MKWGNNISAYILTNVKSRFIYIIVNIVINICANITTENITIYLLLLINIHIYLLI